MIMSIKRELVEQLVRIYNEAGRAQEQFPLPVLEGEDLIQVGEVLQSLSRIRDMCQQAVSWTGDEII